MNKSLQNEDAPLSYNDIVKGNLKFSNNIMNHNDKIKISKKNESLNNKEREEISNKKQILKPRDYQQKIFDRAKNQNSIIYVETGKGKTFISIMLMSHYLGIDINSLSNNKNKIDKNKKIIFFVCDTALIEQQKKAISSILGIEVGSIQGKKKKKSKSDYEFFIKMWDSLNIFVAIPSIIYKVLSCGFINIEDISMLIFDECHHTSDEHPYNKIMNEFYFFYKRKKPKDKIKYPRIYGLTASPLKKGLKGTIEASIIKAMEKLCENLDCVIIIDPEMNNSNVKTMKLGESVEQYLKDDSYIEVKSHIDIEEYKKVVVKVYNSCYMDLISFGFYYIQKQYPEFSKNNILEQYQNYTKIRLKSRNLEEYNIITEKFIDMYNFRKKSPIFLIFEKLQRQIFMILENLCLDSLILYFYNLTEIYHKLYIQKLDEEKCNSSNILISHFESIEESSFQLLNSENIDEKNNEFSYENDDDNIIYIKDLNSSIIKDIEKVFSDTYQILKELKEEGKNYCSDRLKKLYMKIKDLFKKNDQSKIIIFISNRIVAHYLHPELNAFLKENFKDKQCKEVIGINKRKSNSTLTPSLNLKQMNDIIRQFNEDEFNILIGTSAIEEGLDIQSCNAVLALVELRTPKSFIQIKGRARKSNSDFIIFTNSAKEVKTRIETFLKIGLKINELFKDDIVKDFRRENYIAEKEDFLYIFNDSSHSKLTMGNVIIFFNEITQQIKMNGIQFDVNTKITKIKSNNKISEYEYNANVSLKTDLKDIQENFPSELGDFNSKDNALKMCYLYVLDVLKNNNYLDKHLKFICK